VEKRERARRRTKTSLNEEEAKHLAVAKIGGFQGPLSSPHDKPQKVRKAHLKTRIKGLYNEGGPVLEHFPGRINMHSSFKRRRRSDGHTPFRSR